MAKDIDQDITMDQELVKCIKVFDIATYNRRQVFVTIKKYNVNKPPYNKIRLFTAKENEAIKQVAYVNYSLNEFKELSKILETLSLLRLIMNSKLCYLCFLSGNLIRYSQIFFFSVFELSSVS